MVVIRQPHPLLAQAGTQSIQLFAQLLPAPGIGGPIRGLQVRHHQHLVAHRTVEGDGFRQLATQGLQLHMGRGHGQVVFFQQPVEFIPADTLVTDQLDRGKPGALCQEKLLLQGADIAQGVHLQGDLSIDGGGRQQRCGIQYAAGDEGGQCHFFEYAHRNFLIYCYEFVAAQALAGASSTARASRKANRNTSTTPKEKHAGNNQMLCH